MSEIRLLNLQKLEAEYKTQALLADALETSPAYINHLLTGQRNMGEKLARKFEGLLKKPTGWFDTIQIYQDITTQERPRENQSHPPGNDFAPVKYGAFILQAGCIGFSVDYTHEDDKPPLYYRKDWLQSEGLKAESLVACKVKGESMEPGLYEGDTVLIDTSNQEPKDGKVSAINYEGELLIKRMLRDSGQWWLQSDNPDKTRHPNKLCGGNYCMIIGRVVNKSSSRI